MKTFSKHFEILIKLKNLHDQSQIVAPDEIHIVGMGDENIILDIPVEFCGHGHSISISLSAKIHDSLHNLIMESEVHLIESTEGNALRITADLRFTSHHRDQWKQLLMAVEEAQQKIEKTFSAFKD